MNPSHTSARIEKISSGAGGLPPRRQGRAAWALKKLSLFDYLVLTGGLVNLCVIGSIIGFWFAGR
jgi:hypothetical protein